MNCSLGELDALAVKALRGRGCHWGMAQEAGWAVRWLAAAGLPGAAALADWLQDPKGRCPFCVGTRVADTRRADALTDAEIGQPLLLVPFLSRLTSADAGLVVDMATARVSIWANVASVDGPVPPCASVTVLVPAPGPRGTPVHRAHVGQETLAVLTRFAERTYAPASAASREKGAGAGLTDND